MQPALWIVVHDLAYLSLLWFIVSKTGTELDSSVLVIKLCHCVAEKFFWFLLFLLLTLDEFTHVGIMSVNVSSNLQIATTVLLTLIPTWNVFSGFYIAKPVSKPASLFWLTQDASALLVA